MLKIWVVPAFFLMSVYVVCCLFIYVFVVLIDSLVKTSSDNFHRCGFEWLLLCWNDRSNTWNHFRLAFPSNGGSLFQGTLLGRFSTMPTPPPCYRVNLSWANLSISNEKTNPNWHLKPLHFTSTKSPQKDTPQNCHLALGDSKKSPSKIWLLWV